MSQGHFSREKVDCDLENKGRLRKCSHIPEKSLVSQKRDDKTKLQGPTSCLLHSLPSVPHTPPARSQSPSLLFPDDCWKASSQEKTESSFASFRPTPLFLSFFFTFAFPSSPSIPQASHSPFCKSLIPLLLNLNYYF